MSVSGNLKTMELAELMQWLSHGKKTGTLIVDNGKVQKKVFFESGRIVASSSTNPTEQLGHFLVSRGFINELELTKAMELQEETGVLLGKILVSIGALGEDDLRGLLMHQTGESIYDIFCWREGEFRFVDEERIARGLIPLALDVTHVILNGLKRVDDWVRIRKLIPDNRCVLVHFGTLESSDLDAAARRIVELVDDQSTLQEICVETHSSEFQVCRVLLPFFEAGRIKAVRPRLAPQADVAESAIAAPVPTSLELTTDGMLQRATDLVAEREFREAVRHLRAARSLDPDSRPLKEAIARTEAEIRELLEADGVKQRYIPILLTPLEDLTSLPLSPEEGFILSRIDGRTTVEGLLKVSPLDRLEGLILFHRLVAAGYVGVGEKEPGR
ncbi:MAG TPA: DUF4388 domain-containing protein [Thermoanaerobaculia bacterium]|nr:DUF4388 domain-containing protein [Thermoanaerobaculia bacterium]